MPRLVVPTKTKPSKTAPTVRKPLWDGPAGEGPLGGVTQSLLGRYLSCKERCRLYVIEGLREAEGFVARMEYGSLLHAAMEATAANKPWEPALDAYAKGLLEKYDVGEREQIAHWYSVAKAQYPTYLKFWAKHKDVVKRKPLFQEKVFDVPYQLPSGRSVRLRGKFDSVDEVGKGVYLQENKVQGDIKPEKMLAELPLDLQTNMYLTALDEMELPSKLKIAGTRYNVQRRPLAGGKFTIQQKKGMGKAKSGAETAEEFYERLAGVIAQEAEESLAEKRDCYFFYRWKIEVSPLDLAQFQARSLDPILENLLDDYEWWYACFMCPTVYHRNEQGVMLKEQVKTHVYDYLTRARLFPHHRQRQFLFPTGVWNSTLEGRSSPYDEYILTGSMNGLTKATTLFRELES